MAFFVVGVSFLLFGVTQGESLVEIKSMVMPADANILIQEWVKHGAEVRVTPTQPSETDENEVNELQAAVIDQFIDIPMEPSKALAKKAWSQYVPSSPRKLLESNEVMHLATSLNQNMFDLLGAFTQYNQVLIISNVFAHFDVNSDKKVDRKEMDAFLAYLGENWTDDNVNTLMNDLDHMVSDDLLEVSEFFFWFTWPKINVPQNLQNKLRWMKWDAEHTKKQHRTTENNTDIVAPRSSSIPADPANVLAVFGKFSQYTEALKILLFFKTFDLNWDSNIDNKEFAQILEFLEPGRWTKNEIAALTISLDVLTKDGTVQLNEFFYWFTPNFFNTWEKAIHKQAEQNRSANT